MNVQWEYEGVSSFECVPVRITDAFVFAINKDGNEIKLDRLKIKSYKGLSVKPI